MSRLLFFLIAFWLATGIGANAQPSCALPHRSRLNAVSPSPPEDWNDAEKWAWMRIVEGEIADFNLLYCHRLEPGQPEGWDDPKNIRRLSAKFLRDIARKPFRNSIPDEGVFIAGAWFQGGIDLRFVKLEGPLAVVSSRVDGYVGLLGASVGSQLDMSDATFKGVNMETLQVKSDLFISDHATFDGDVNLDGATIGGQLDMSGSSFKGVEMGSLQVPHLAMTGATFDGDVNLSFASVGGVLNLSGATFHRNVNLAGATVTNLLLGSTKDPGPQWDPGSRLILHNTNVGGLQDRIDQENNQDHDACRTASTLTALSMVRLSSVGEAYLSYPVSVDTTLSDQEPGGAEGWTKKSKERMWLLGLWAARASDARPRCPWPGTRGRSEH